MITMNDVLQYCLKMDRANKIPDNNTLNQCIFIEPHGQTSYKTVIKALESRQVSRHNNGIGSDHESQYKQRIQNAKHYPTVKSMPSVTIHAALASTDKDDTLHALTQKTFTNFFGTLESMPKRNTSA
jgi:hypothetical protein